MADTDFPSGVVDAIGNPHFVPTGHMGPGIMRRHGFYHGPRKAPVVLEPEYMTSAEFQQAEHEVFASGAGNPLLPGWSGTNVRREKGILVNMPSVDEDDTVESSRDDAQYSLESTTPRGVVKVLRDQGHAIGPDEKVEADPFGSIAKRGVVARSGNEDPNIVGDDFAPVGMGAEPVVAAKPRVNWGATALLVALGVGLIWAMNRRRR